jgi:serine/threonine protein kinase
VTITADELDECLPKKWEVHSSLGKGGQGTVFLGAVDGTPAAIKLFHDTEDTKRVGREVEALQKLTCPNVVKMLAYCTVDVAGRACQVVAYEYLDGGDLKRYVEGEHEPPTKAVLVRIALDVCGALEALWSVNIVHRDIKPANIVETSDGRYVLVDLAFARHLDESSLTQTGWTVGTKGYMSPEHQRAWKNLTVDSDMYSLGATLVELATGELPSGGEDHVRARLRSVRPDLGELTELIVAMLAPLPYARPQVHTVVEVLARLAEDD